MYQYIAQYYKMGLYQKNQLDIFVSAGMMTETQKNNLIEAQ
ncbi:XkdX family protein [Lapidilactobacillus luobeiensis]|nr:XkdX family protein [Lapidilactobacillus luobeiensis]